MLVVLGKVQANAVTKKFPMGFPREYRANGCQFPHVTIEGGKECGNTLAELIGTPYLVFRIVFCCVSGILLICAFTSIFRLKVSQCLPAQTLHIRVILLSSTLLVLFIDPLGYACYFPITILLSLEAFISILLSSILGTVQFEWITEIIHHSACEYSNTEFSLTDINVLAATLHLLLFPLIGTPTILYHWADFQYWQYLGLLSLVYIAIALFLMCISIFFIHHACSTFHISFYSLIEFDRLDERPRRLIVYLIINCIVAVIFIGLRVLSMFCIVRNQFNLENVPIASTVPKLLLRCWMYLLSLFLCGSVLDLDWWSNIAQRKIQDSDQNGPLLLDPTEPSI